MESRKQRRATRRRKRRRCNGDTVEAGRGSSRAPRVSHQLVAGDGRPAGLLGGWCGVAVLSRPALRVVATPPGGDARRAGKNATEAVEGDSVTD